MNQQERNGLQDIIDKALADMRAENGGVLEPDDVNLAELARRAGITRSRARTIKAHGFRVLPHGRTGSKAATTVLAPYADELDGLLARGVDNSTVCYERLVERGYPGGLTTVKDYIAAHRDLVPAKRRLVAPGASRGQRYETGPGESYQMDWGFVRVEDRTGAESRLACFAMVCHHCGSAYVEFFPNARQENLFIGMVHAFAELGVPERVLTDNMASVVNGRDADGRPVWNAQYAAFMSCVGFKTRLCRPRHPYTKGKVERLVRFVKGNFLAGRSFLDLTELNAEALRWCRAQAGCYRRALGLVPAEEHRGRCLPAAGTVELGGEVSAYLCPRRRISFDGFVSYEGRRFGVPYWYAGRDCRVNREGEVLHVYSDDLSRELAAHPVTWGRRDSFCEDQYADAQPAEAPTAPVRTTVTRIQPPEGNPLLSRFDFEGRL